MLEAGQPIQKEPSRIDAAIIISTILILGVIFGYAVPTSLAASTPEVQTIHSSEAETEEAITGE